MTSSLSPIDTLLVSRLIKAQFPQWAHLLITPVDQGGWCNMTFQLGDEMVVRLPRLQAYACQVEKESIWLPRLLPHLPLPIPQPVALGMPSAEYPWHWSIYRWISGDTATPNQIAHLSRFATGIADFLLALQRIDASAGPHAGEHSFFRGGALHHYDRQTREAIALLGAKIDAPAALTIWATASATTWDQPPVWVHGDISFGNLLVDGGNLCAVIDFGNLSVGDPACDLAIAWAAFDRETRDAFHARLQPDNNTWVRGRAWALWKALILAARLSKSNAYEASRSRLIIDEVLSDFQHAGG